MIKVIGKSEEYIHRVTCRKCSSILEYTDKDTEYRKANFDYTGDFDWVKSIKCPACDTLIEIKND